MVVQRPVITAESDISVDELRLYKTQHQNRRTSHCQCITLSSENLPFLEVFPSIVICPLLRLIFWNLTTRCLAVNGGDSVGECDRLLIPAGFWTHYNIVMLTFLLTCFCIVCYGSAVWRSDSALASISEVTLCRTRLVVGWVSGPGFNSRCRKPISVFNQPSRSTQPGHPSVGSRNEYQPKGGDALRLGSKGRYGSCVGGR